MFGASFLVLWATVSDSWTDSTAALEYVCRKVYTSQKKKKRHHSIRQHQHKGQRLASWGR